MTPAFKDSTLTVSDRIATLTFNRHDVRNALTGTSLVDDIVATVDWINANKDISALIITGSGSAFCAGGNIKDMAERQGEFAGNVDELAERYRQGIQRMPLAMAKLEVPAIAAVNGPAIGAGFDLANMCDLRIASDKAKFGETFINLGIIPGDGGAWFLQRLIGYQKAAELTFTGKIINAEQALDYGILLEVTGAEDLLTRANQLASDIASKPPQAVRMTKRLMKMAQRQELPDFLDLCAVFQGVCHQTDEHKVAVEKLLVKMNG